MNIIAIDPGSVNSAFVIVDDEYTITHKKKCPNDEILDVIKECDCDVVVIERVASYGMPVGREVFDTCEWIGRFVQTALDNLKDVEYVFRQEEKLTICHSQKAGDANIRRALIDRFSRHDFKNGKGTKQNPDFFYGFCADIWSAFAVAVTYLEKSKLCSEI